MRVALLQHDPVWEDKASNRATIRAALDGAKFAPRTLVVLPELAETGFSSNVDVTAAGDSVSWATSLAKDLNIWLVAGIAERDGRGKPRNAAIVVNPEGVVAARYWKMHPFTAGREERSYPAGREVVVVDVDGVAVAPIICYDLRFPELFRAAVRQGAEVFAIGACWPTNRIAHWDTLSCARAIENQALVIAANRTGKEPTVECGGRSAIIDWQGVRVQHADARPCILEANIDIQALRDWRSKFPALRDMRDEFFIDHRTPRCG
ncbi:MAG: carbon-nitrogen family hydrolase [Planctomycetota bacterium]|nr:carbon-nitrogen family hydrolase [Planctomycetota bacterium]